MSWRALLLSVVLGALPRTFGAPAATTPLPSYVLQYAPLAHLSASEAYWPADVATHLTHVGVNSSTGAAVTFASIGGLSSATYLTSKDDVEDLPAWLNGVKPDASGLTSAPATIVAVQKAGGIVDAFYFYFYSYDHAEYLGLQFGDHVGDWEHSAVRFLNGVPQSLYLSAHSSGAAYAYSAVPASGGRAVTYIATGTHANYATVGSHQHDLPGLDDTTDAGPLWDVTKNYRGYWFDTASGTFSVAGGAGAGAGVEAGQGVGWLQFGGKWGDKQYALLKEGQYCITSDECKYVDGPTGPIAKNLGRATICQSGSSCTIATSV